MKTETESTKKELAPASKSSDSNINTTKSISQNNSKSTSKRRKESTTIKHFTINSRTTTLALKFYPEQLLDTDVRKSMTDAKTGRVNYSKWKDGSFLEWCKNEVKNRVLNFESNFDLTSAPQAKKVTHHWEVEAIMHDRDQVANENDMFEPSIVKPHFHLILRDSNSNRFTVRHALKALDLKYDSNLDSDLFYNQGATPIKDFSAYSCYLTHDTQQAIDDGKEHYEFEDLFTNMTPDELKDIRDGYKRFRPKSKLRDSDWNQMADEVTKLGKSMGDFEDWTQTHLTFAQTATSKYKSLQNLFTKNLHEAVDSSPDITKCVILIHGDPNDGKSYTSKLALNALGEKIYKAHTGTGKYDGLRRNHTAIIFDDRNMSDALSITDNQATILHGRGTANDKPFLGHYVICLTNLTPQEWFNMQGIQDSQLEALKSRFFVCSLKYDGNHGRLYLDDKKSVSIRGTAIDIEKRNELFTKFFTKFNELIKGYHPLPYAETPKLPETFFADNSTFDMGYENLTTQIQSLKSENFDLRTKVHDQANRMAQIIGLINSGISETIIDLESMKCEIDFARVAKDLSKYDKNDYLVFENSTQKCTIFDFLSHMTDYENWLGRSYSYAYVEKRQVETNYENL